MCKALARALALATTLILTIGSSVSYAADATFEYINTEAYPRVVARITYTPQDGQSAPELGSRHVIVTENGVTQSSVDVIRPAKSGTPNLYELTWVSSHGNIANGTDIKAEVIIAANRQVERSVRFEYTTPTLGRVRVQEPVTTIAPAPLQSVELPVVGTFDEGLSVAAAGALAGAGLICIVLALWFKLNAMETQERLRVWVAGLTPARQQANANRGKPTPKTATKLNLAPLVGGLSRVAARLVTPHQSERLRRSLLLAGRPSGRQYNEFMTVKFVVGVIAFIVGYVIMSGQAGLLNALLVSGALGYAGFLVPNTFLVRAIRQRQYLMRRALPDALDLMTIGVSAGLAFDGALSEVVEKWDDPLSREFSVVLGELKMGTSRRQALLGLADRTQVEEIQTMVSQLIQADELGMSLTEALLTLANQMRIKRRQQAEEQAHKATIKMLIPLVFLIFPAIFVVILGPAVPDLLAFVTEGPK
ncbi:MAG: type II secretion system F family protein [Chloroflexota bacterium]